MAEIYKYHHHSGLADEKKLGEEINIQIHVGTMYM